MKQKQMWPGLISAGSRVSIRFVAMMTFTSPLESNPSNWFSSSNIVRWISLSPPELESYLWKRRRRNEDPNDLLLTGNYSKTSQHSSQPNSQLTYLIIFFVAVFIAKVLSPTFAVPQPAECSLRPETCGQGCDPSLDGARLRADAQERLLTDQSSGSQPPRRWESQSRNCGKHWGHTGTPNGHSEKSSMVFPLKFTKRVKESLPLCPNGINFIDEHDGWCMFFSNSKQFPNELGPIA